MKRIVAILCALIWVSGCETPKSTSFVTVSDGQFFLNGKPYYFIGTNYWYGAILGSPGKFGNRDRLLRELDLMQQHGITNIRIMVGAEGPDGEPFRVTPALLLSPGSYNEELLDGLDFLLAEMGKRRQHAILFLTNSWDWSGGFAQYASWKGYGAIPYPNVKPNTWPQFMAYAGQFLNCEPCKQQFFDHVTYILNRTNSYTGVKYTDDPTIMTWEVANEPRAFSTENIPALEKFIEESATLIKSIDKNHMVTTGTEGQHGCEQSLEVFERIHAQPYIDYLTMHIWPKNWGWLDITDIPGTLEHSIENTNQYMDRHFEVARRLGKPIVFEEFGLPRDAHGYSPIESTTCRDAYYENAFRQVVEHRQNNDVLAGCNFWTFAGEGRPSNLFWVMGDDYLGDPPNEEQGLNSVFDTDSTIPLIAKYSSMLSNLNTK